MQRSPRASAPPSPRTPRPWTTGGPTTSSPPSAPTVAAISPAWAATKAATRSAGPTGMEAGATPAPPRHQHARHRLERPRGYCDQRSDLRHARRLRLGDPTRGSVPRPSPPRRRHVAIPPSRGRVRHTALETRRRRMKDLTPVRYAVPGGSVGEVGKNLAGEPVDLGAARSRPTADEVAIARISPLRRVPCGRVEVVERQ